MSYSVKLHVWGEAACFTRPEMKVERVSYDVMTPSAARGVLEAIYWKPQMRWEIERIHLLKPVRFTNLRRNEVGVKASAANAKSAIKSGSGSLGLYIEDERQQRAGTILRDVGYVIEGRIVALDAENPAEKHYHMFKRRAEKGQCFQRPYLGCREFLADFAWVENELPACELSQSERNRDLGFMLLDIAYTPATGKAYDVIESNTGKKLLAQPQFFRAALKAGVMEVPAVTSTEVVA
ncbi:type I-C CRISPR-associated protein Cas5c [Blastopirellula sp. J2-11]|uniref:type I-C CRISPR-associated protein Cas5c n=1 Tax=Blastopirellula sp. J2-11 TaxID=2943192 RepID=UPI0021C83B96|nr:type I-C CRISPR-associated protein Cas5c [Blastopirellula sp. J2-11]UUO04506.1 type I-C CRISPR-associated protein Cas5c [Blastopirellula sp. J2-11]